MNKRILFISDHGDPLEPLGSEQAGGQNNYVKQLALALEQKGYAVDVITHWNSTFTPKVEQFGHSCRVIRIAAGKQHYVPKSDLYYMMPAFFDELKTTIDLHDYHLIHTHYWLSGLVGLYIQEEHDIPWIHTNHSLGIAKQDATGQADAVRIMSEKRVLSSADYIVATSSNERKLIRHFVDKPSPIAVIPIGVDDIFTPQKVIKTKPFFAFAGRLQSTKGIYTLIDAFQRLINEERLVTSIQLIIAGGSKDCIDHETLLPKNNKLCQMIEGFEHCIKFIGPQSQTQLARLFSHATATIVPSYYESFGMVAAEAQACGSPVIASRVGGLQEVVKHSKTGLLVEKKNASQLKSAMATLLHKPLFATTLGQQAASFAQQRFNWTRLADNMVELYKGVQDEEQISLTSN